jgi:type IV pilus assembly protein PilQ
VAQFQPTVARVVVDLTRKSEYDIAAVGDELRIAFGATARASNEPAPAPVKAVPVQAVSQPAPQWKPAPAPEPVRQAAAPAPVTDLPSQVPTVATDAPSWSVPEPARVDPPRTQVARAEPVRRDPVSKGARSVIRQAAAPAPAQRPPTQEDVFGEAAASQPTNATQTLSASGGGRTLSGGPRVFNGEPLSLNLKDADIKDVLRTFAELTGLNIAVDPGVSGAVTVDFVDVPWDQALDLILRQNGLTFTIDGNVMRIGTVERIAAEATATRRLEEEERLKVQLTTLSFKLSYARAADVAALLKDIASPRARIIVDNRTNQLIVSEIPDFLRTMQNLITTVDIPSKQVMIEARIVESLRTFSQQWGFEWGFGGDIDPALGNGTGLVFPNRIGYEAGPFNFALGDPVISLHLFDVLGTFNLDFALHAAEDQGYAKVVSAPRVTTQDNQPAEIQSGFQIPYQTRVNFTTTVTYLDATLRLSVTPQITEAGTVIMDIAVQKNEPATGVSIAGAAGSSLTTRQARTRLMVRDGGTAVIAGIFQTRDNNGQHRLPFVHNVPVLGALFRTHTISTSHDELLIFITPRIVRG